MAVYTINPLEDPRWDEFLNNHQRACVFHTEGWLEALHRTYRYTPLVFSTSPPGHDLKNGIVFCHINSRLTGPHLVSLPFSDHCDALVDSDEEREELSDYLVRRRDKERWEYVELRPLSTTRSLQGNFRQVQEFCIHTLDLCKDDLFQHFHKDSTQRKVQRAEREAVRYDEGRAEALLQQFYGLLLMTRRRHGLPRQPLDWFQNLKDCLGERMKIRVASKDGVPIASILTIRHKDTLMYKYGCSDARYHHFGGMHLLLWKTIQEGVRDGLRVLDLGRSDLGNTGLITFKNRWGANCQSLTYLRYPGAAYSVGSKIWKTPLVRWGLGRLPGYVLDRASHLLYKHMG